MGLRPKENTLGTTQPRLSGAQKGQLSLFGKPGVWKVQEIPCVDPEQSLRGEIDHVSIAGGRQPSG